MGGHLPELRMTSREDGGAIGSGSREEHETEEGEFPTELSING